MGSGTARRVAGGLGDACRDCIAVAFDGHGENVATLHELRAALDRALGSGKAPVIDVQTDSAVRCDLLRNLGSMGANRSPRAVVKLRLARPDPRQGRRVA